MHNDRGLPGPAHGKTAIDHKIILLRTAGSCEMPRSKLDDDNHDDHDDVDNDDGDDDKGHGDDNYDDDW